MNSYGVYVIRKENYRGESNLHLLVHAMPHRDQCIPRRNVDEGITTFSSAP